MRFTGKLNTNKVFASLYNQIISLQVFDTGIADLNGLYDTRKVDDEKNRTHSSNKKQLKNQTKR